MRFAGSVGFQAVEMLRKVGISGPEKRISQYPFELSGGMKQRAIIAMALSCNPDLVIADEPVTALDVSIQAQVVNLLEELQEQLGLTYLFIAHDLSMVRHICDRVAVMYLGKLVELGQKDDLYESPLHPYTVALLSAVPIPDPTTSRKRKRIILQGDIPSSAKPPPGCRFHTRCPRAFEPCDQEEPEWKDAGGNHYVACHLY